jgi:hypothetical protein
MDGSSFDLLLQAVLQQKQRLEDLLEENRNLRRQLTDLRAGRGIVLEINGKQFPLISEMVADGVNTSQDTPVAEQAAVSMPLNETPVSTIPETPYPDTSTSTDQLEPAPDLANQLTEKIAPTSMFLEQMLIDEFASASTDHMATWKGPGTQKLPPAIDEDEKAALRRELIGSFLLE